VILEPEKIRGIEEMACLEVKLEGDIRIKEGNKKLSSKPLHVKLHQNKMSYMKQGVERELMLEGCVIRDVESGNLVGQGKWGIEIWHPLGVPLRSGVYYIYLVSFGCFCFCFLFWLVFFFRFLKMRRNVECGLRCCYLRVVKEWKDW